MEPPSLSRSFLLFRSSLHISQNALSINRLTLTEHHPHPPFSRASQATFKPAFSICPARRSFTDERRLKRRYDMSIHYRSSHQQDISAVNERRKEETIFPSSATMISAGFSSNVRRRVLQIPLHTINLYPWDCV